MNSVVTRQSEGKLARRLPVVYDDVVGIGENMDIGEGIMYSIMKNPVVRIVYFLKDVLCHFVPVEHEHKNYLVRPK